MDGNETPGGLASTDVTPEGFVNLPVIKFFLKYRLMLYDSSTMLGVTLSSPTINILTTALMKRFQRTAIGIHTNVFLMFVTKVFGFLTLFKII